jgi:SRSO17 transposase
MIPIVEYPSVVRSSLPIFRSVLNKPRMKNFATYITGLMVSTNHTISFMNNLFYAHNDQSALNHFITDSRWSDDELDKKRYKIILDGLKDADEGDGILEIDDTLSHKTGKHIEFVGKFFDHTDGTYTLAHDIVSTHIVKGRLSIPLDFEIYLKEGGYVSKEQFRDKNHIARDLVTKAHSKGISFTCVTADSWYYNQDTTSIIQSLGKDWVFGCKSNRLVLLPRGWTNISEWSKTIPKEKFKAVEVWYKREKHVYYCYAKDLIMKNQGRVNILVSYDNADLEGDPVFLCTNRLDWEVFRILRTYVKRWRIDTFYRDVKQSLGLEDYEIRKIKGVRRHITMVFIAHTLLELRSGFSSSSRFGIGAAKTGICLDAIGSQCRHVSIEVLTSFISLALKIGDKVTDARKIASIALSSRSTLPARFAKV